MLLKGCFAELERVFVRERYRFLIVIKNYTPETKDVKINRDGKEFGRRSLPAVS